MPIKKIHFLILFLWAFLVILGLASRSYFPIDETRYATVAWNMWLSGDYLVPTLNGIAYSHKPPLLFWLMNLGWGVFGVNDWWPRLIPSLFALASVFVTRKVAALLWPNDTAIKDNASLILIGSGLWVIYTTALMFDMMIAFFTVLGIWGLLIAYKTQSFKGWLLFTLAVGGGLLAKGPTILLQLLPVALLAPFWNKDSTQKLDAKSWYLPILLSVIGGAVIVLAWAIPAGIHGGTQYQHDIFWGQTANRMVNSFAHERPVWWYLAALPLLLFPWLLLGSFWRGLLNGKSIWNQPSMRFCLAWLVPVFLAFSFISGKQVHYVLPVFPAFALILAKLISDNKVIAKRDYIAISVISIALGTTLLYLPFYAKTHANLATWIQQIPLWLGILAIVYAIAIFFLPKKSSSDTIAWLSISSIALVTLLMLGIMHVTGDAYDVRPISKHVKTLEAQNIPVAYLGRYAGMYNFLGRLQHSPENVTTANINAWFDAHPHGRVIAFFDDISLVDKNQTEFVKAYKGMAIAVLNQSQFAAQKNPDVQN